MSRRSNEGFTLIELAIALVVLAIVIVKVTSAMTAANDAHRRETTDVTLEDQARRVLDQIAYAVMGADRDALIPDPENPNSTPAVDFQVSLGVDDEGELVWGDPERIGVSADGRQIEWKNNPDTSEEVRVAWCNVVREWLEGELPNGEDDNGNGLVDERGLNFSVDGKAVKIRLTLERFLSDGTPVTRTVETISTCRN